MSEELLPCPFCGGPAQIASAGPGCHFVRCEGCTASTDDGSREQAIAAWNRRVAQPVEGLREAVEECASVKTDLEDRSDYARGWNDARFRIRQIARKALAAEPARAAVRRTGNVLFTSSASFEQRRFMANGSTLAASTPPPDLPISRRWAWIAVMEQGWLAIRICALRWPPAVKILPCFVKGQSDD